MADLKVKELRDALMAEGLPQEKVDAALVRFLQEVKPETVHLAVIFLGAATLILAVGSVGLAIFGKPIPGAVDRSGGLRRWPGRHLHGEAVGRAP
jgi:hypothetical protein